MMDHITFHLIEAPRNWMMFMAAERGMVMMDAAESMMMTGAERRMVLMMVVD